MSSACSCFIQLALLSPEDKNAELEKKNAALEAQLAEERSLRASGEEAIDALREDKVYLEASWQARNVFSFCFMVMFMFHPAGTALT